MRRPSPRVLANRCTVTPVVAAQDADGGLDVAGSYPAGGAYTLACSYQCEASTAVDADGRSSTVDAWSVLFATADLAGTPVKRNDRVTLLNPDGSTLRVLYADGGLDYAGRGSTTEIPCREVL
jgi:hypothetical protein